MPNTFIQKNISYWNLLKKLFAALTARYVFWAAYNVAHWYICGMLILVPQTHNLTDVKMVPIDCTVLFISNADALSQTKVKHAASTNNRITINSVVCQWQSRIMLNPFIVNSIIVITKEYSIAIMTWKPNVFQRKRRNDWLFYLIIKTTFLSGIVSIGLNNIIKFCF